MRSSIRWMVLIGALALVVGTALPASADHATRPHTPNIHALGHSPRASSFEGLPDGVRHINSDIAFWGNLAFNGNYDGARPTRQSAPAATTRP